MNRQLSRWSEVLFTLACLFSAIAVSSQALAHSTPAPTSKPVELGATAVADAQGRLWAVGKHTMADGASFLALRRSEDGGKIWSAPLSVANEAVAARGEERPKIAFGAKGELYIVYTKPRGGPGNPHIGDIRFVRSIDGGKTFSQPISVHANQDVIVHSFGSMIVDKAGNIYVAWVDSRLKEAAKSRQEPYAGNALYYAVSRDGGKSFDGDYKIADHTCECCRLSLSLNSEGRPVVMWRHIFAPNIRDHAIAELSIAGKPGQIHRVSFDDWRVDACPHHGPSIAFGPDGARHQAWFNVKDGEGGIFYARANKAGELSTPLRLGSDLAKQPDAAVAGKTIAIVWKQFDGEASVLMGRMSTDDGSSWTEKELARTANDSDRPQLLHTRSGLTAAWPTKEEGMRILPLFPSISGAAGR
jgi:hypothetical protein